MKVCVTGGNGFLGQHVVKRFEDKGYEVQVPTSDEYDLRRRTDVKRMYDDFRPDIIVHAAALCGGIQACSAQPATFLYDNLVMGLEMMDVARFWGIKKYVQIGSVCAYPLDVSVPTPESELWNGYPEPTNAPYGIAKRTLMMQAEAYRQEYGMSTVNLVPANMYGPGDHFDPKRSHVIPALILKCLEAKKNGTDLSVWGTGKASREFLYVEDCADAIVLATEKIETSDPINVGSGVETTIKHLVEVTTAATGFTGNVVWDATKPEGQPRRLWDVSRAEKLMGFKATTTLEVGIEKTVKWYLGGDYETHRTGTSGD